MNTHADKTQEDKSQSVANTVSQKQSGGESIFQFVDDRLEAIARRELQEMANNSPRVKQLKAFQEMANNSPRAKQTAQLQATADNYTSRQQLPDDSDNLVEASVEDELQDSSLSDEEAESDTESLVIATEPLPISLGGEVHKVEYRLLDGEAQIGVASTWEVFQKIRKRVYSVISSYKCNPKAEKLAFSKAGVKYAHVQLEIVKSLYQSKLMSRASREETRRINTQVNECSHKLAEAVRHYVDRVCQSYGDLMAEALGIRRQLKEQVANTNLTKKYHTGKSNDPIPIVWYKDPTDYKPITITHEYTPSGGKIERRKTLTFGEGGKVSGLDDKGWYARENFTVSSVNKPKTGWKVKKVVHRSDRKVQRRLNHVLKNCGFEMGQTARLDGDHVKDLGFGGSDDISNYWPLDSRINRRAATGYNSSYVVNYIKDPSKTPESGQKFAAKGIGGLFGRWFVVKKFMSSQDSSMPLESGSTKAGTEEV